MAKWLDKYDAPQAQNGIEGTMGGLTDVGFNYNGAWGGTMQMGGVLPGAVGFTYARTQSPAPSNGPYAKKTKASAQDGEEVMKGREFVEKWMNSPMYKQMLEKSAQGPEFERINTGRISNLSVPTNVSTDIHLHGTNTLGQKQHRVRTMLNATGPELQEMMKVLQTAVDNPKDKEAKRKAEELTQPVITGWNIGMNPKLKPGTLEYEATLAHEHGHTTDDPFVSKLPHQMSKKELMSQDLSPYIPKSDIEKMQSYYQGKVNDDLTKYVSKPQETRQYLTSLRYLGKTQGVYDPFTEKITPEQYRKIKPTELSDPAGMLRNIYTDDQIIDMLNSISRRQNISGNVPTAQNGKYIKDKVKGIEDELQDRFIKPDLDKAFEKAKKRGINYGAHNGPLDAIRHATSASKVASSIPILGLPIANILGAAHEISANRGDKKELLSDLYNNFIGSVIGSVPFVSDDTRRKWVVDAQKSGILSTIDDTKKEPKKGPEFLRNNFINVLNEETKKLKEREAKLFDTKIIFEDGGSMKYYQAGLDFKPKTISQDGSEIPVDPMGYWNPENVGSPVIIPSNVITMEGVDQPLLGISDTGDVQYMEPGEDYEFDGEYVTEYPVAQKGKTIPAPTTADSLKVYNAAVRMMNYYSNDKRHKKPEINIYDPQIERSRVSDVAYDNLETYRRMYKDLSDPTTHSIITSRYEKDYGLPKQEILKKVGKAIAENKSAAPGTAYYKDAYPSKIDINAPSAYIDYRIAPQGFVNYPSSVKKSDQPEPAGSVTGLWYYDPLAIKPYHMRTPKEKIEWEKKYGKKETPKAKPTPPPPAKKKVVTPETVRQTIPPAAIPSSASSVKSVSEKVGKLDMFGKKDVELLVDNFGNYEWFRKDDDIGDLKPIRRATREEIEYSKKQKQRNGGVNKADEYPIEKLDQLLNFTNYNKPTKGGWLDKYN